MRIRLILSASIVLFLNSYQFERTEAAACTAGQFQCVSDQKCLNQQLTCNGANDCVDGSDEKLNTCTDGCLFNNTQTVKPGETAQDQEWWYTCTRSRWLVSGCVANGQRYKAGEQFQLITSQGIYWGKCEQLDKYHFMRQPYGCVDYNGQNMQNGKVFQMNQLFWGVCSLTPQTTNAPEVGTVTVNSVKWKIVGCNDGSQTPVPEGQEFIWIIDPFRLGGVQIRCHLPAQENEWPTITPTACVVNTPPTPAPAPATAQGTNAPPPPPAPAPVFKVLRNKCYVPADKFIYYCEITPKTSTIPPQYVGKVSAWDQDWLLNATDNNPNEVNSLKQRGFSECSESPKTPPVVPKIPLPPPPPPASGAAQQQPAQPQQQQAAGAAAPRGKRDSIIHHRLENRKLQIAADRSIIQLGR